jgi:phosphatidylserine/phosphatidylglycerophosphate/cardiolipin synthase-like enzyme
MTPIIGADYVPQICALIAEAKRNIDIVLYDWRWYEDQAAHPCQQVNIALANAVRRGVLVRAVVNNDIALSSLKKAGIQARRLKDKRTLHCKLVILDEKTLVIGSHNFTRNAFAHNIEASVAVEIPEGITRWREFFANLYGL